MLTLKYSEWEVNFEAVGAGSSGRGKSALIGILVHGGNHWIVDGPLPDRGTSLALARHWSVIQIGAETPLSLEPWRIVTKAFRENLEWAVVVPGDGEMNPAVTQLLAELMARAIPIHKYRFRVNDAGLPRL